VAVPFGRLRLDVCRLIAVPAFAGIRGSTTAKCGSYFAVLHTFNSYFIHNYEIPCGTS
jgi:hypothetical protein